MNLVMQFRKVCNHPDLFERQEPKTPLLFESPVCQAPRLIYDMESFQRLNCGAPNEVKKMFSIFSAENVHRSSLGMEVHIAMGPFKGNALHKLSDGYVPFERIHSNIFIFVGITILFF
jgi:SNF2 family DNA or RNA helicase